MHIEGKVVPPALPNENEMKCWTMADEQANNTNSRVFTSLPEKNEHFELTEKVKQSAGANVRKMFYFKAQKKKTLLKPQSKKCAEYCRLDKHRKDSETTVVSSRKQQQPIETYDKTTSADSKDRKTRRRWRGSGLEMLSQNVSIQLVSATSEESAANEAAQSS